MKRILLLLTISCCSPALYAQQDEAAQKAWMEYMTPGSMHKMMALANGEWKTDLTVWMAPGAPPTKETGACTNKMILGGRYQESLHTSTFGGQPFEGIGTLAYDNAKKVFISSWIDNMGTGIMLLEGKWDDATRSINFTGKSTDPASGKDIPVRETLKWIDDNHHFLEMYMMMNGTEFKTMEIKLTRK